MSAAVATRRLKAGTRGKTPPPSKASPPDSPGTTAPLPANGKPMPAHFIEVPPNAYKTLSAIREMGYDSLASVMDLIDNSVDADATRIAVQVRQGGKGDAATGIIIDVLDNGVGMTEATLGQALRLGSDTKRDAADLGKYGMGLVTASLSMAQSIYVLTRTEKGQAYEATFDMAAVQAHNKFIVALAPATAHAKVIETLGDRGTLVRLSHIDRINDTNVARFAATLRTQLAQVYRQFIGKGGIKLSVNGKLVQPADPLMRDHPETTVLAEKELHVGPVKFKLIAVELPDLGQTAAAAAGVLPHNSGFYIMRNGRQIMGGETFDFYRHHHSYTLFRAELSFTGEADPLFHVDIKKSQIHPDERLLAKLKEETEKLIAMIGRRGRERGSTDPVTLKLDGATDIINRAVTAAKPAPPAPQGKGTVKDTPDPKEPADAKGKATTPPPEPDTGPRVKFVTVTLDNPTQLYRAVEKGGRWLIELNDAHPLVRFAAEAKHKAASTILSAVAFSLAATAKDTKHGEDMAAKVGAHLSEILGVPAGA